MQIASFRAPIYIQAVERAGSFSVFKTGAFNHSATHPYEIAGQSAYRETINIRKRDSIYGGRQ